MIIYKCLREQFLNKIFKTLESLKKGIRQWMINICTSVMMINKITPSVDYVIGAKARSLLSCTIQLIPLKKHFNADVLKFPLFFFIFFQ